MVVVYETATRVIAGNVVPHTPLNNVLDKVYYESIDPPPLRGWYGEPRNWMLRVDER